MDIVWDPKKAGKNLKSHGIRFSDAETVLFDPFAMTLEEQYVPSELRYVTVGVDSLGRLLVVVYTYRNDSIRLISARKATSKERKQYEKGI